MQNISAPMTSTASSLTSNSVCYDSAEQRQHSPVSTSVQSVHGKNEKNENDVVFGKGWTADCCDYVSIVREVERQMATSIPPVLPCRSPSNRSPGQFHGRNSPTSATIVRCQTPTARPLSDSDQELIAFYAAQTESHSAVVDAATADFYQCMTSTSSVINSYPASADVFVRRSRMVVLAAHKLVYIGDAIARHVSDPVIRDRVASAANTLCDRLKAVVMATKEAALAETGNGSASAVVQRRCVLIDCVQRATDGCRRLNDVINSCVTSVR
jgi:hypothetical protein